MLVNDGGGVDFALASIDVDISAIDDLQQFLMAEINDNISPRSAEIIEDHQVGVAIQGPEPSTVFTHVKGEYDDVAADAVTALHSYLDATRTLALAVQQVAEMYRNADGMVTAKLGDVLKAFDDSWTQIQQQNAQAEQARQALEAAKLHHLETQT